MTETSNKTKKYRIVFDKQACIGAAACAAVAPDFYEMEEDVKAHLFKSEKDKDGNEVLYLTSDLPADKLKKALKENVEAAEVCPVQVIHVYDEETGEKLA